VAWTDEWPEPELDHPPVDPGGQDNVASGRRNAWITRLTPLCPKA